MEVLSSEELYPGTQEKLYRWWQNSTFCDVTLACADSVAVQAHSLILALHSSYFQQKLGCLKEMEQPGVHKIDMPSSVIKLVLEFIYSGKLHVTEANVRGVSDCAEQYRFDSIVRLLENSKFNPANVKDTKQVSKLSKHKSVSKLEPSNEISINRLERISSSRKRNETNDEKLDQMPKNDTELQCARRSVRVGKKSTKKADYVDFSDDEDCDREYDCSDVAEDVCGRKSKKSRLFSTTKTENRFKKGKSCDRKQRNPLSNKELTTHDSGFKLNKSIKDVKKVKEKYSTKRPRNLSKSRGTLAYVGQKIISSILKARKLCLSYLTINFMKYAFSTSSVSNFNKTKRKLFQCCMCQRTFQTYSSWSLHYRTQHMSNLLQRISRIKSKLFPCTIPKTRRSKRPASGSPVMMKSGRVRKMPGPKCSQTLRNLVGCEECGVKLASRASLKKHLMAYHNMDRSKVEQHRSLLVQCEVVDCAFANIDIHKVERHVRASHPEMKHPCSQCPVVFVRQDLLNQHILRIHQNLTRFACSVCCQHFKRSSDQKIHEQLQHGVQHHLIIHSCEEAGCEYKTTAVRYLNAHRRTRHLDNRIQCSYCNLKLKSKVALQMHVNALHLNKRPFLCEMCGSGFCDQWTLQRHIAFRHSSARAFSCRHCSYACNNRIQFMNHSYQQHGERVESDKRKELMCPHCEYRALSASRMNAHVRHIHADPHKYTCEICGKGFKNPHYLRDHQVIHSDSSLQCPHCDYSPLTNSKLKKHLRTQHLFKDIKPYSCPYCSFACTLSGNCRKHVTHKHPGCEVRYNTDSDMMEYMRRVEAQLHSGKVSST